MEPRMSNTMTRQLLLGASLCAILAAGGCGVAPSMKNGTVDAAKWAFTTQIKTMNLDLVSRPSMNTNGAGQSLSTVVRVYQLKTPQAFEQLGYTQLQTNDIDALKADLLGSTDIVLRPGTNASISEPMNDEAEYVAIVAFFRDDGRDTHWKLVVPKKQWKATDPVKVELRDSALQLAGANVNAVKRSTSQQKVPQPIKPGVKDKPLKDDWAAAG
jgi:type VI secretion system protein VasD